MTDTNSPSAIQVNTTDESRTVDVADGRTISVPEGALEVVTRAAARP